jgi:hypothetical protein
MKDNISVLAKYLVKEDLTMFEIELLRYLLKREDLLKEIWEKSKKEASKYNKGNDLETIKVYFNDYVGRYVFDYMRDHTKGKEATGLVEHALCDVRFWKLNDILIETFNLKGGE